MGAGEEPGMVGEWEGSWGRGGGTRNGGRGDGGGKLGGGEPGPGAFPQAQASSPASSTQVRSLLRGGLAAGGLGPISRTRLLAALASSHGDDITAWRHGSCDVISGGGALGMTSLPPPGCRLARGLGAGARLWWGEPPRQRPGRASSSVPGALSVRGAKPGLPTGRGSRRWCMAHGQRQPRPPPQPEALAPPRAGEGGTRGRGRGRRPGGQNLRP